MLISPPHNRCSTRSLLVQQRFVRMNSSRAGIRQKRNKFFVRRCESSSARITALPFPADRGKVYWVSARVVSVYLLPTSPSFRLQGHRSLIRLTRWNFSTLFSRSCARYQIPLPLPSARGPFSSLFALARCISHRNVHHPPPLTSPFPVSDPLSNLDIQSIFFANGETRQIRRTRSEAGAGGTTRLPE